MRKIFRYSLFLVSILWSVGGHAQDDPFAIILEPLVIPGVGGLQSYAFGQHAGKWLLVGGRLDGLHRRQPWASFDLAGHNNQLIVVDPVAQQRWSAPLSSLPQSLQEQLSATNMEFYQEGDYLYCLGGYGYSATAGDHTTYDLLTAINVPAVIAAVINGEAFTDHFRQLTDPAFQVTGGQLKKIGDVYHLLGGQKFIGRYNPMGPDHGPGFLQEYTNSIRRFQLVDNGETIAVEHEASYVDSDNLHRRDYNAEPQILPNGEEGITMFAGVFQKDVDLPFLHPVNVDAAGFHPDSTFQQYYNHYHCPTLPLYAAAENKMHTVFFGGIAQFYAGAEGLVQDDNVPFVNTVARVVRDADGRMTEYKLPVVMPTLLGAGAEFIPGQNLPQYANGVLKLDSLTTDTTLVGYIFGGISSSGPNIFFENDGTQSNASNLIFKVSIKKSRSTASSEPVPVENSLGLVLYPNPSDGSLNVSFSLRQQEEVKLLVFDALGSLLQHKPLGKLPAGEHRIEVAAPGLVRGGAYLITLVTPSGRVTRKLIVGE